MKEDKIKSESLRIENPRFVQLESVSSTNDFLQEMQLESDGAIVVLADSQTGGRGQQGSRWDSYRGDATFSLLIRPKGLPSTNVFLLSQLLSLALRALLESLGIPAEIKWPNDILVKRKKVCGILIETHLQGFYVSRAILGVGMNLAARPFGFPVYPTSAVTLADCMEVEKVPAPHVFVQMLLQSWNAYLDGACGDLQGKAQRDYLAALFNGYGFHEFEDSNGRFLAEIRDVTSRGELVLHRDDGTDRSYWFKSVRQMVV